MTAQFADEIRYRGRLYAITAVDGHGLFDAAEHGLEPGMLSTACWRGIWCRYALRHGRLTLTAVQLARSTTPARRLFGVKPRVSPARDVHPGAWHYRRLDAPIPFTGRLLVGAGHVDVGRLAMGFLPAWLYQRVHELHFTKGRLTSTHNRSTQIARVRHHLGAEGLRPRTDETVRRGCTAPFRWTSPIAGPIPNQRPPPRTPGRTGPDKIESQSPPAVRSCDRSPAGQSRILAARPDPLGTPRTGDISVRMSR